MNNDSHFFILLENPIDENLNKNSVKIVDRSSNNPYGKTIIEAILQDVDNKNRNGRIYSREACLKMIKSNRIREQLYYRGLKGEAGHPGTHDIERQVKIEPKEVSHRILDIWMEGSYIKGKIMASGPYGRYFEEDVREGEYPAFSFRGIGRTQVINGQQHAIVTTPVTWDRVYYPSHKVAYITKSLNEYTSLYTNSNPNELIMTESKAIPITNSNNIQEFIKDESKRLKRLSECFRMDVEKVKYNKITNTVNISNNEKELIFPLEEYVRDQIKGYIL